MAADLRLPRRQLPSGVRVRRRERRRLAGPRRLPPGRHRLRRGRERRFALADSNLPAGGTSVASGSRSATSTATAGTIWPGPQRRRRGLDLERERHVDELRGRASAGGDWSATQLWDMDGDGIVDLAAFGDGCGSCGGATAAEAGRPSPRSRRPARGLTPRSGSEATPTTTGCPTSSWWQKRAARTGATTCASTRKHRSPRHSRQAGCAGRRRDVLRWVDSLCGLAQRGSRRRGGERKDWLSVSGPGGPWLPVADNVPNNGRYQWHIPADSPVSDDSYLRALCRDNVSGHSPGADEDASHPEIKRATTSATATATATATAASAASAATATSATAASATAASATAASAATATSATAASASGALPGAAGDRAQSRSGPRPDPPGALLGRPHQPGPLEARRPRPAAEPECRGRQAPRLPGQARRRAALGALDDKHGVFVLEPRLGDAERPVRAERNRVSYLPVRYGR